MQNRWNTDDALKMSEPERLLYRSNLLGADLSITNFGGGNTSAKVTEADPVTGQATEVLWVKGSGGDLGSMGMDGFSTLYLDKLLALEGRYTGIEAEDDIVAYLPYCTFNNNPRAASIDTPLHAFLPFAHIDHMHPDSVIAIAAAKNSESLTAKIFDNQIGWLPWQRPGFDLGLRLRDLVQKQPGLRGAVLAGHGLFTWGETSRECYETTLWAIDRAQSALNENKDKPAFGGLARALQDESERLATASRLLPAIRARISDGAPKVGHFNDQDEMLQFVASANLELNAALGTSCPDHFLRTKIKPLIVPDAAVSGDDDTAMAALDEALETYRQDYAAYYERNADADSPAIRDPNPVVFLIPGVGMATFAANKATARIAGEFYVNAVNVMREADRMDEYVGIDEKEAFNIEYWALEEAKLQRMPAAKPLAGRIALVTGAAGAIGRAVAERLLREHAVVMLADIDAPSLESVHDELQQEFGADNVRSIVMDVTDQNSVSSAYAELAREYGGVDILVANAGIASSAAFENTDITLWNKIFDVLSTGYFLTTRDAYQLMKQQQSGNIVFIGSKNALAAASGAAAYASAKAAELHLARCLALEGAAHGIRVNTVNPDAVLAGSKIWDSNWREARARDHGVSDDELEAHYRNRSLLKKEVLPADVAEAVYFFTSDASAKSTGNILNVDAGNAAAFPR